MQQALDTIAVLLLPGSTCFSFPCEQLRYQHAAAVRSILAEPYAPASANHMLAGLHSVIKGAWCLGLMSAEDYQRAVDIRSVSGQKATQAEKGRHIQGGELRDLLDICAGRRLPISTWPTSTLTTRRLPSATARATRNGLYRGG